MQYSFLSAAVLALVSSVVAQTSGFDAITSPTQDQNIPAGSSFDIIWQPGTVTDDITITLLQGATPSTLQPGPVIAKSIPNSPGKFTWTVPTTSSFATYGFKIVLDSTASSSSPTFQYSYPFHITGGSSSSVSGSASSTTTIQLSTGPSYTAIVTSTSSSVIPSTTSTVIKTSSATNSTSLSATLSPTSSAASNLTLSTTLTKASSTATSGSAGTSSASPVSKNAAATQVAGSIAMVGGLVLALAF